MLEASTIKDNIKVNSDMLTTGAITKVQATEVITKMTTWLISIK